MSINNENNHVIGQNNTIVYRIVNYMASFIGGLNNSVNKNNPCIGILTPMSPLMIGDQNQPKGETMVLPTPEPLIQLIPNRNINNNFLTVYSGVNNKITRFGPKVTPYVNLNNGLLAISDKDDAAVSNDVSYINSPNDICSFSTKIRRINNNIHRSQQAKNINYDFGIIKSPVSSVISNSLYNNCHTQFNSLTEIIVTPELANTLQRMISIISEYSDGDRTENDNINNEKTFVLNRFQKINRRATIGGLNYALMSYSATIIQRCYKEYENNRFKRYVDRTTRDKYSKDRIFDAIYTIQRHWRIYTYRNKLMREYLVKSVMTARNEACSKITAYWYGYKTRKLFDSIIRDVEIKWIWSDKTSNDASDNNDEKCEYLKQDVKIRGSFTSKPWEDQLSLNWDESKDCYSVTTPLSKGVHYLQFIVNDEIRACGSMEIVVLPIVGVSNKISIFGNLYESTRKFHLVILNNNNIEHAYTIY